MCGIAGIYDLRDKPIVDLQQKLYAMNDLLKHRGPDGEGAWNHESGKLGFAHRRLSIIDLNTGNQPMSDWQGNWITFNGEIYNYLELKKTIGNENFITKCDTEVILQAYRKWGDDCLQRLRGMFAFALWDDEKQTLFCARDRFGIKPFYYMIIDNIFYFASEIKALLPFVPTIETDPEGLRDYITFQFCLDGKTLFNGIRELMPGHSLTVKNGQIKVKRYWEVYYNLDFYHTSKYFEERIQELILDSVRVHLRSDVPLGAYISGGLDSSLIASIGSMQNPTTEFIGFTGKFSIGDEFDESKYAQLLADWRGFELQQIDITHQDFLDNIENVIYHLDYPVAGPGSFPQYMVSQFASHSRKVVLGGQGGDEIFGGYIRYLIAYLEQCIKAAIDGTMHNGNFIVTYESIIPNLTSLRDYKPLLKEFWREGLFDDLDKRYFRLINRAPTMKDEIKWDELNGHYHPFEKFEQIFRGNNVQRESYFDSMTHFDFKTLLTALLQVEDRVSMAHGLESRVPLLDHPLVEFAATIPSNVKFKNGTMKNVLKKAMHSYLPNEIIKRKDKMGFPVPLTQWMKHEIRDYLYDLFSSEKALSRAYIDNKNVLKSLESESKFGRKIWGLLCLEIWHRQFHDKHAEFRNYFRFKEETK